MKKLGVQKVDVSEAIREGLSEVEVTLKPIGVRWWMFRLRLGAWLIKFGAKLGGMTVKE